MTLSALPAGRFLIAFDHALVPNPTWTRIDAYDSLVTSYQIDRGRQVELDRTDTGRATVQISDTEGILDPTNPDGPFYGQINPLLQAALQHKNPVDGNWYTRFRGWVEDLTYDFDPSQRVNRLTVSLVDIFEILAAIEMMPGTFGDTAPAAAAGQVFFEDRLVDDRMLQILGDAGIPADLTVIFSGNVRLWETVYSPSESVLTALQEAADAEWPGVANLYTDRVGRLTFHGRLATFTPEDVDASTENWDFIQWKAGDHAAVNADPAGTARLRQFAFDRGLSHVINQAFATPSRAASGVELTASETTSQIITDATSQGLYGIRAWSAQDLITKEGLLDDTNDLAETRKFAEFYVSNYKNPVNRATSPAFRSMRVTDQGATKTWELMSKIDIGDAVEITVGSPGGGGFDHVQHYVQGIHEDVKPLNPTMDDVTLTLDVSPAAVFDDLTMFAGGHTDPAPDPGDPATPPEEPPPTQPPGPAGIPPYPVDDDLNWMFDQPFTYGGPSSFTVQPKTWTTIPFSTPLMERQSTLHTVGTVWTEIDWDDPLSAGWINPDTPRVITIPHDMGFGTDLFFWMQIELTLEIPEVEATTSKRWMRIFETTHQKPLIQGGDYRNVVCDRGGLVDVFRDASAFASVGGSETFALGDPGGFHDFLHGNIMIMPNVGITYHFTGNDWLPRNSLGPILKKGMRCVPQVWHDATVPLTFSCAAPSPWRPHFVLYMKPKRTWGHPWSDWPVYT